MKRFRLTLRTRLTLVYGALFVAAGLVVIALTWLLMQQQFLLVGPAWDSVGPIPAEERAEPLPQGTGEPADVVIRAISATQDQALAALVTWGVIAVAVVGAVAVWVCWLMAGRMLRPLATITATARRIADAPDADRRMHERLNLTGPHDEVRELADTFDGMLARLDAAFDGQRRFIANASHELRTPLTLNRTLIEVASDQPGASAEVRLLGATLLEINARHERLIDGLLLLARSERELGERRFVDLADLVEHVAESTGDADGAVRVETDAAEAPTSGDPVLLEHLVRNLLQNGVRHNLPEGGWVRLETRTAPDGRAMLVVSNSGPVVPEYELPTLFEPFRRLDGERTAGAPGVGLGLSIVRAIVQAHGGEVALASRPEGGLVVTVTLPGERYDPAG
ncbi:sensor histidine kinase [Microbacterium sp.]|uniref:sensor histidine kinase n=1 Tax=Microbacterium sp. TaxID=51671 RepID=UPI002811515A|nr:HAMP domain-containing sensor histidine kinase [Microbacterium sp.]